MCVKSNIQRFFIEDDKENIQRNYVWNILAGFLNAAEAVILSMIVTRVTNLNDAGILAIAFATSNLFVTVGKYGVRNYQITDVHSFSFCTYLHTRYVTVSLMLITSSIYTSIGIFINNYSLYKVGCIIVMCLIFSIEAIEDVYWGHFHKNGRLDIGAKAFVVRWAGILFTCLIVILVTKNLFVTLFSAFVVSFIVFWICKNAIMPEVEGKCELEKTKTILKDCFPLCISSFLNFYICNSPKYMIDRFMDDEIQACFGFVSMPVFVIGLLSSFLYQPLIVRLSDMWNKGEIRKLIKNLIQQILAIVYISVICIVGAYLIGIPVLSSLYSTNLEGYKKELILMVSGGGILAIVNFQVVILTIMRKQLYIIGSYGIGGLLSIILFPKSVLMYRTCGVAMTYDIIMIALTVMLGFAIILQLRCHKNKEKEDKNENIYSSRNRN